jgi:hypothetical protein
MSGTTMPSRQWWRGSSRNGVESTCWSRMQEAIEVGLWTPRPAALIRRSYNFMTAMNLFGTVYSCNAVAPIMKQQRSGKIITVSSVAGTAPSADGGYAHYGAAKAAIAHYTRRKGQDGLLNRFAPISRSRRHAVGIHRDLRSTPPSP